MKLGAMQDWPLRVMRLVDHAEREHGRREIVSAWADGSISRTTWAGVAQDARRMAQALERLGVRRGDRVATLGMNHVHQLAADQRRRPWDAPGIGVEHRHDRQDDGAS